LVKSEGPIQDYTLVCFCKIADDYKNTLTISSPITFENQTDKKILIKIFRNANQINLGIQEINNYETYLYLDSKRLEPVPFDRINDYF